VPARPHSAAARRLGISGCERLNGLRGAEHPLAAIAFNKLYPGGFEGCDEPSSRVPPAAKGTVPGFPVA
jgi:hypothetical protein